MSGKFVILVSAVVLWVAKSTTSVTQPIPNCPTTCGDLTIPFPFGMNPDCYLDAEFAVSCNSTTNTTFMLENTIRVLEIFLDGTMRVYSSVKCEYFNESDKLVSNGSTGFNLKSFASSSVKNQSLVTNERVTKINHGAQSYNPCKNTTVVEAPEYDALPGDLIGDGNNIILKILDWAIGYSNCSVAQTDLSNYACRDKHSECVDVEGLGGYNCNCTRGFEGNPYLINGCQDIDECLTSNPCRNGYMCINLAGNYKCSCPNGYEDDGTSCRKMSRWGTLIHILSGTLSGFGFILVILVVWLMYKQIKRRRKLKLKQKFFKRNGGLLLKQELSARKEGHVDKTKLFTSKELEKATDHYNKTRILGHGGQGTVYKGMLDDGRIVAIKMSKKVDEGNLKQFINEVVILSQLNHRNIVKLHGCCLETEVPRLVYEYVPNGTLSNYIRHENEEFPLCWSVRLRIAIEAATALSYLHTSASVPIYHRDIKSENILLDEKYRVKIADFGTSRTIAIDQTHLTTKVLGTFGYLDPEYFRSSQFTEKSDVYSFGVVLVELLTGQRAVSVTSTEGHSLVTDFLFVMEKDRLYEILDVQVIQGGSIDAIKRVANLAKHSLNLNGKKRPTMNEVARELESISISNGRKYPIDELDRQWEMSEISTRTLEGNSITTSSNVQPFSYFLNHTV